MVDVTPHVTIVLYPEGRRGVSLHGGFCHGIYTMLKKIDGSGSMSSACKQMGMAYSKAWKMLNEVEDDFGVKLTERDGAHGSTLTDEARSLIAVYEEKTQAAYHAVKEV